MIQLFVDFLTGCTHLRQTRPFTISKRCYTVCLDCGHELPYSWSAMRPLSRGECAKIKHDPADILAAAS